MLPERHGLWYPGEEAQPPARPVGQTRRRDYRAEASTRIYRIRNRIVH